MVEKTLIIEESWLRGGFTQIPNCVLLDPKLEPTTKLLYALLLSYAWSSDQCFPGHDTLALKIGITRRWVSRNLKNLKDYGLIDWERRGQGKTNVYTIKSLNGLYPEFDVNSGSHLEVNSSSLAEVNTSSHEEYKDKIYSQNNIRLSTNPKVAEMQTYMMALLNTSKDMIPNPGKEAGLIKKMEHRGFSWLEIKKLWISKVNIRGEFVSMHWVNEDIGKEKNGADRGYIETANADRLRASVGRALH